MAPQTLISTVTLILALLSAGRVSTLPAIIVVIITAGLGLGSEMGLRLVPQGYLGRCVGRRHNGPAHVVVMIAGMLIVTFHNWGEIFSCHLDNSG